MLSSIIASRLKCMMTLCSSWQYCLLPIGLFHDNLHFDIIHHLRHGSFILSRQDTFPVFSSPFFLLSSSSSSHFITYSPITLFRPQVRPLKGLDHHVPEELGPEDRPSITHWRQYLLCSTSIFVYLLFSHYPLWYLGQIQVYYACRSHLLSCLLFLSFYQQPYSSKSSSPNHCIPFLVFTYPSLLSPCHSPPLLFLLGGGPWCIDCCPRFYGQN